MKKFNLFWGGLMAIAFTACTNEELLQEGNSNGPSAEQVTITAYTPGDDSASSRIAQTMEGTKIKLGWDAGTDVISVTRGSNFVNFTSLGGNDFESPEAPTGEGNFYAVYPAVAEETVAAPTAVPFDLSNQTGADTYLMYSESESGKIYQFHHAAAYLKATFPETLKNSSATITLTTPEGVYTNGTINLTNGALTGTEGNTITKQVALGENTVVWFALPPMAATNKTLNFMVEMGDKVYTATLEGSEEKAIEAGKYYSATVELNEVAPAQLPNGSAFNDSFISSVKNNTKTIVFEAKSPKTGGTQIGESTAYYTFEGQVLTIYTAAPKFVFASSCSSMFRDFTSVTSITFGNCIDTSNVTDMQSMFYKCTNLKSIDLGSFDTSNVTNMQYMFRDCENLETIDLSSFNTSKVSHMLYMFYNCKKLVSLDLCNFTFKANVKVDDMFRNCEKLGNVYVDAAYIDIVQNGGTRIQNKDNIQTHTHQ